MSEDNLNPILNPDCECPEPVAETPTPCPTPDAVSIPIEVLPDDCPSCDDVIIPPAPVIADITITTKCLAPDDTYQYVPAQDSTPGSGLAHYFYELHPACARPMAQCKFCISNNVCPEDVGLSYRKGDDNIYSIMLTGADQPLLFWVHDSHKDRVMSEVGCVKIGQSGMYNEWLPRKEVVKGYVLSPSASFPGGLAPFLNETAKIGTIPTTVTETAVTSILDNTAPVITAVADQTNSVNDAVSLQVVASDADAGSTLTYSATDLPAGLSINSSTGLITGTATTAGTHAPTVTVTDGITPVSDSFAWVVS